MDPEQVVARYFSSVRSGDIDHLISMYDVDATYSLPDGKRYVDAGEIREMHMSDFSVSAPAPSVVSATYGELSATVQTEARTSHGTVIRAIYQFRLNDEGDIRHVTVVENDR